MRRARAALPGIDERSACGHLHKPERLDAFDHNKSLSWRLRPDAEQFAAPLLGDQSIFSFSFSFPFWLGEPDAAIRELDAGRFQDGAALGCRSIRYEASPPSVGAGRS